MMIVSLDNPVYCTNPVITFAAFTSHLTTSKLVNIRYFRLLNMGKADEYRYKLLQKKYKKAKSSYEKQQILNQMRGINRPIPASRGCSACRKNK